MVLAIGMVEVSFAQNLMTQANNTEPNDRLNLMTWLMTQVNDTG